MATATVNKQIKRFRDLDLSFTRHPVTDDIVKKSDIEAVKFAVKNLLLTSKYEVPFHPEIGSTIVNQLFENYTIAMKSIVTYEIASVIQNYEPRAVILDVKFDAIPHEHKINLTILFKMVNVSEPITINLILERTR